MFSILDFFNVMLLTDTFIRILLCFFLKDLVDSVLFLWIFFCMFFNKLYFARHVFIFFFIRKFLLFKAYFFHYIYVFKCIFLAALSLALIFIYLFFNLLNKFINKDFFFLIIFDSIETFFVKKNIFNTLGYLRLKFPVLSPFIFIVFHNFSFFKCFKFFYFHILDEQKRQKGLWLIIKNQAVDIDKVRIMLVKCFHFGWANYYDTFSETWSEINIFDSLARCYVIADNLGDAASRYLLLRGVRPELYSNVKLLELKKTMELILLVSDKKKYVYDSDD